MIFRSEIHIQKLCKNKQGRYFKETKKKASRPFLRLLKQLNGLNNQLILRNV